MCKVYCIICSKEITKERLLKFPKTGLCSFECTEKWINSHEVIMEEFKNEKDQTLRKCHHCGCEFCVAYSGNIDGKKYCSQGCYENGTETEKES